MGHNRELRSVVNHADWMMVVLQLQRGAVFYVWCHRCNWELLLRTLCIDACKLVVYQLIGMANLMIISKAAKWVSELLRLSSLQKDLMGTLQLIQLILDDVIIGLGSDWIRAS